MQITIYLHFLFKFFIFVATLFEYYHTTAMKGLIMQQYNQKAEVI